MKRTNNKQRAAQRRRNRLHRVESLEDRRLMAADVTLTNGLLAIKGDAADDHIVVQQELGQLDSLMRSSRFAKPIRMTTVIRSHLESNGDRVEDGRDRFVGRIRQVNFLGHGGDDYFNNKTSIPTVAYGGSGDDIILGGSSDDKLFGYGRVFVGTNMITGPARVSSSHSSTNLQTEFDGNDVLYGNGGNDQLYGGTGTDSLFGSAGNDLIFGDDGDDRIYGGSGRDHLAGHTGNDLIYGGSDADRIYGGWGEDRLYGQSGDDVIYGNHGADIISGSSGHDDLFGGDGGDEIFGGSGNDELFGDNGDDQLHGDIGRDEIFGGYGKDEIFGGSGNDELYGNHGNDRLYGGSGNDELYGGHDDDTLVSIDGDMYDVLRGNRGNDSFWIDKVFVMGMDSNVMDVIQDATRAENATNVHKVARFANGADKTLNGDNIADPTDGPNYKNFANLPLFASSGPSSADVNQNSLGDCWLMSALGTAADTNANSIYQSVVNLGDGTYAVEIGGSFYRVDADLPTTGTASNRLIYAGLGQQKSIWVPIIEKAYAFHRSFANTYQSLIGGWASSVFAQMGAVNAAKSTPNTGLAALQYISRELSHGKAVVVNINNPAAGAPLVSTHVYMVVRVNYSAGTGTPVSVTLRNPWGIDGGGSADANPNDGLVTVTGTQLVNSLYSRNNGIHSANLI